MEFSEDLNCNENEKYAILGSSQCSYTIHIEDENTISNSILTPINSKVNKPLCFNITMQNILTVCAGIFNPSSTRTTAAALTRSVAISSPWGGGKTQFLHSICDECKTWRVNGVDIEVIYVSCSVLSAQKNAITTINDTTTTATTATTEATEAIINTEDKILHYLDQLLLLLGVEKKDRSTTAATATLLVLDDLDYILDQYATSRDEAPSSDPTMDSYRIFGYHLSVLLDALKDVTVSSKLLVLGATHRGASQLLRAHTGCPEFEKCWELSSPGNTERASILQWMLQDTQLQLENIKADESDSEGAPTDVVCVWAERLAGLTAGFLPGDLQAVVQRITLIHRGEQVAAMTATAASRIDPSHSNTGTTTVDHAVSVVSWHCALEAVVSTAPKQLQQLSATSRTSGGERLSWKDFAGYDHIIADLQRRLATVQENQYIHTIQQNVEVLDNQDTGNYPHNKDLTSTPNKNSKKKLQAAPLRGVVIHGPTGCGKTLLASVIASEVSLLLINIVIDTLTI